MAKVKIEKVSKSFDRTMAVQDFSLDIDEGEFIVLVGPSGCGKTTLLRMVAGLETVTRGEIFINDVCVTHALPKKRDIAMVFQNYALYPHMTVYKNMAFSLKMRRQPKKAIEEKVTRTADMLGLSNLLKRHPHQLSGGQKQRVALGRAIVRNPQLFLFDEPLSNLDAKLRVLMRAEILDIHRQLNNTSIYVTHDQLEAMTMGTRIVVMKDGAILQAGTPQDIYNRPANKFVGGFIGSPAMNMIHGVIDEKNDTLCISTQDFRFILPDHWQDKLKTLKTRELVLGVRPESFYHVENQTETNQYHVVETTVNLVEPLGSEQLIHFTLADDRLVAKLDPRIPLKFGDRLALGVNIEDLHIFDSKSEKRL